MNDVFDTINVAKVFFAWEDEKKEKWLAEMAAENWKLTSMTPYYYQFQRGNPENVISKLDYKITVDKDYQDYLRLSKNAGWEFSIPISNWPFSRINSKNNESSRSTFAKGATMGIEILIVLLFVVTLLSVVMV